jgi:hypothetical protein
MLGRTTDGSERRNQSKEGGREGGREGGSEGVREGGKKRYLAHAFVSVAEGAGALPSNHCSEKGTVG